MVDGTDNQPTSGDQQTGEDRAPASGAGREKPVSFDFKLRLGSREETSAQLSGRATGELVQLQPIDWDALVAPPADEPRSYQTDGDLQSIIVELANQIAGPDTSSHPVVHVTASATFETARPAAAPTMPAAVPAPPEVPATTADEPIVRAATPVLQPVAPLAPTLAPLPTLGRANAPESVTPSAAEVAAPPATVIDAGATVAAASAPVAAEPPTPTTPRSTWSRPS